ncbi:histidine--tRNA ligase [Flavobacterium sp.]|uniref:histidine--tRNA ligase n=1 Tax=Flavobacterium sp. TaxID=239 RepID=UPI003B9A598E
MKTKAATAKGTRDFNALEIARRNYITGVIKSVFEKYGFSPIETPTFENSETLMGKYGEEGDRLIFKILNSGDFLKDVPADLLHEKQSLKVTKHISEKALRYDLTVPFARYVVQHRNEIELPFKRYQIQPVWRADRPQKGRFREFYQCDADVVGSKSLWQEVELVEIYAEVFQRLELHRTTIKINNRKILAGIAELIGAADRLVEFTVVLDKLDKIGEDGVIAELKERGFEQASIDAALPIIRLTGSFEEKLQHLDALFADIVIGKEGVSEIRTILNRVDLNAFPAVELGLDLTLARGLNYYTGTIMEVAAPAEVGIGSIGGAGRYDDLTGIFGMPGISGVGLSFGLDRIYLALEALNLFSDSLNGTPEFLVLNYGVQEAEYAMQVCRRLRKSGKTVDFYPDAAKIQKQLQYASKRGFAKVVLCGSSEMEKQEVSIKDMNSGTQVQVSILDL